LVAHREIENLTHAHVDRE